MVCIFSGCVRFVFNGLVTNDNRYDVSGLTEAQFEPGSNDWVLKNRLGIMSPEPMDMLEAQSLQQTMDNAIRQFSETYRFTAADIYGLLFAEIIEQSL